MIGEEAHDMNMVVNAKKTQILNIDSNLFIDSKSFISPNDVFIQSDAVLKILGFIFSQRPSCRAQIDFLAQKFRAQLWSLRRLAAGGLRKDDLLKFFTVHLRPILEYTQVTYHSMSGQLEKAQSRALKIIFGEEFSYNQLLQLGNTERLENRRTRAFNLFAQKAAKNKRISDRWFPFNIDVIHDTRRRHVYLEEQARTDKLYRSPIFAMRRYLNSVY